MKSFFLEEFADFDAAKQALSELLPNQVHPWLLRDKDDDVVAYFYIESASRGKSLIQADVSGRHYLEDEKVVRVLKDIQKWVGGTITDDDDLVL